MATLPNPSPRDRLESKLKTILGSNAVYFQPPTGTRLETPCIVYELSDIPVTRADNKVYKINERYTVTLIHNRPDNTIKESILDIPMSELRTISKVDGRYHYYYDIYI